MSKDCEVSLKRVRQNDNFLERTILLTSTNRTIKIGRASGRNPARAAAREGNAIFRHAMVSRCHGRISYEGAGKLLLYDDGSRNGTSVNNLKLKRNSSFALKNGDVVILGSDVGRDDDSHAGERTFVVYYKERDAPKPSIIDLSSPVQSVASLPDQTDAALDSSPTYASRGFEVPLEDEDEDSDYSSDDLPDSELASMFNDPTSESVNPKTASDVEPTTDTMSKNTEKRPDPIQEILQTKAKESAGESFSSQPKTPVDVYAKPSQSKAKEYALGSLSEYFLTEPAESTKKNLEQAEKISCPDTFDITEALEADNTLTNLEKTPAPTTEFNDISPGLSGVPFAKDLLAEAPATQANKPANDVSEPSTSNNVETQRGRVSSKYSNNSAFESAWQDLAAEHERDKQEFALLSKEVARLTSATQSLCSGQSVQPAGRAHGQAFSKNPILSNPVVPTPNPAGARGYYRPPPITPYSQSFNDVLNPSTSQISSVYQSPAWNPTPTTRHPWLAAGPTQWSSGQLSSFAGPDYPDSISLGPRPVYDPVVEADRKRRRQPPDWTFPSAEERAKATNTPSPVVNIESSNKRADPAVEAPVVDVESSKKRTLPTVEAPVEETEPEQPRKRVRLTVKQPPVTESQAQAASHGGRATFGTQARAFALGALAGSIGIIGALIALPDSMF